MVEAEGMSTASFAFPSERGAVVVFNFTMANQEPFTGLYKLMATSIQRAE